MVEYSNSEFATMLKLLQNSQSAIQSLSTWCLIHHKHYKSIIIIWLNTIRKVKIKRRLTLFYLANHVIQYSKKKNYKFFVRWKIAIQKAIPYVRDETIQFQISRIIKIWEERDVYDVSYLADLTRLLTTPIHKFKSTNSVQEIQIDAIKTKIRYCAKLEQINGSKMKNLTEAILSFTNEETIQNMLKDRTLSHELINDNMSNIESYIKCLKREIIDRAQLIDAIEVAKSYYKKKNTEMKIVAQEYFNYTERVKLLKSVLELLVSYLPIKNPMSLPHINGQPPSASSVSIVDLNIHNMNNNAVLNSDKYTMNSSMINTINDTDIAALTTVQEPYGPASMNFPAIKNQDKQSLTNQFLNDAPSLPPDETLSYFAFPNQTKMNNNNKSTTYSASSNEAYEHTPMSSTHQFITSEFSINMVSPTNLSSIVNESTMPGSHVPQTACDVTLQSDWTTNDTPASSLLHEKISYQNTHIINKTDGESGIDHCVLPSKIIDSDETVSPKTINETSCIEHRNFNSSTHPTSMNSLTVSVDADCQAFCDILVPSSPPNLLIEAVSSPLKDNLEIVDMDLSDNDVKDTVGSVDVDLSEGDEKSKSHQDQKYPVLLPPPLLPMHFYQQNVPYVTYQWKQTSQSWSNDKPNFNENQWNIKQSDQWKHPKQWEQDQRFSNIVHNNPYSLQPQHSQRIQPKEDFMPKCERRINIWASRDPRNFISYSRPTGTGNQD